ncbi:LysR substrate-binding domain-containing protein [Variovorax sp.]|uniref:LysR substrate-binding domain-containing protein n=1 Tax=Variovorax sp. TaxID=1871043 RepID=UPI002D4A09FF|nr:LysR substrate-binding domain-containing protein [Variovorax sp.]HYP84063.1 LysR substrate-binding domain-containing protein [Variovorax sp.]
MAHVDPDPLPSTAWARRLRLRQLQLLQELARRGSLTAVADALHLTQPAVSQQLAEIESALGVQLFERARGLRPTPFGQAALRWAAQTLAGAERLDAELQALREGASGRVRLGVMLVAALELVPRVAARVAREDPALRLALHEDILQGLWPRLVDGELDLMVGRIDDRVHATGLPNLPLVADRHCVALRAGHPLARRRRPSWADTLAYPWVLPPDDTALRRAVVGTFSAAGLPAPRPQVESSSLAATQAILRDSDCLGVMSGTAGRIAQADGLLRTLPLALAGHDAPVGVVWRDAHPAPAVLRVIDALRTEGALLAQQAR